MFTRRPDPVSTSQIRDLEDRMGDKYDELARMDHERNKLINENKSLKARIDQVEEEGKRALAAAEHLVAEWASAMEAWKELAVYLKEEAENCHNAEAHPIGKSIEKRVMILEKKDNEERVKRGIQPRKWKIK